MKTDNKDLLVAEITCVRIGDQLVELTYTGGKSRFSIASAYEFVAKGSGEKYVLKMYDAEDGQNNETTVLKQVNQLFQTEGIFESSPPKQMGYMPVPVVVADTHDAFNDEFMRAFNPNALKVQLQTSARGQSCERGLPVPMADRLKIAIELAKLLRLCARAKIAYVDIKPLEHVFWSVTERGRLEITLIDWGNARADATSTQLVDDIRKFCMFLPELIYGKKMLDLSNKGKFEYPIQKENDRRLISLLGQLSFNTNNPPLTQKYAQLVGDLVAGALNDIRLQAKVVDVWDDVLRILFEAQSAFERDGAIVSWETLRRDAETMITNDPEPYQGRDFRKLLDPRLTSLASYRAWLIPAIRFIQLWYGKIDLIPQRGFDDCVELILKNDPAGLKTAFEKLQGVIRSKFGRMTSRSEFMEPLLESLDQCADVIQSWEFMREIEQDTMSTGVFQVTFSTSNLRVIDPLLADAYRRQSKKNNDADPMTGTRPLTPDRPKHDASGEIVSSRAVTREPLVREEQAAENALAVVDEGTDDATGGLPPSFTRRINQLLDVYENLKRFSHLANVDFFRDLNDFLLEFRDYSTEATERLEPIFTGMIAETDRWIDGINPDRFLVPDAFLNSIDWIQTLSSGIESTRLNYAGTKMTLLEIFQDKLYTCQIDIARAGNASLELRQNPALRDLLGRIKMLRKKLDNENLLKFRRLLAERDYGAVQQIIDDHYIEFPEMYERLRAELNFQERNDEDQKVLSVINTVVNDLYHNSGNLETSKFFKNQGNVPYISQRLADYRQRNAQLIDIQDELIRTKNLAVEAKTVGSDGKKLSAMAIVIMVIVLLLSLVLLVSSMTKNFATTQMISRLERQMAQYQQTNEALVREAAATPIILIATDVPEPTQSQQTTVVALADSVDALVPEPLPTDPAPTEIPAAEMTADALLSPADRHLKALLGQQVKFTLSGNMPLYGDDELNPAGQIGTITDYAQDVSGKLLAYNEKAVNLEITFNIYKDQVSESTQKNVKYGTNIRRYSDTPGNTPLVFITLIDCVLVEPIQNCTVEATSFCHGTFSLWIERSQIENSIK